MKGRGVRVGLRGTRRIDTAERRRSPRLVRAASRKGRRAIICAQRPVSLLSSSSPLSRSLLPSRAMTIPLLSIVPAGRRSRAASLSSSFASLILFARPPSAVLFTVLVAREIAGASTKLKRSCTLGIRGRRRRRRWRRRRQRQQRRQRRRRRLRVYLHNTM